MHSNDPVVNSSETANASLCANFANYFTDKIDKLRQSVASKIPSGTPAFTDPIYNGPALDYLLPVTEEEVLTMIDKMPPKSSPVDFIPTSTIKNCSLTFSAIIARLANLLLQKVFFQPPSNLPR